ncbi:MAG: hypothetical protein HY535_06695 [Chloroflexi bacterium]|nr:hypothetical protein [Chloroflexota bacterium]
METRPIPLGIQGPRWKESPAPSLASAPTTGLLRGGTLLAAGGLLAASAVLFSLAPGLPHPWQLATTAFLTLLLGAGTAMLGVFWTRVDPAPRVTATAIVTLVVVALPLVRYIPPMFTFAYEQDLESFFPLLWPYSFSLPLLFAILGDQALAARVGAASGLGLVGLALLAASLTLFFGAIIVDNMTVAFLGTPFQMLLAQTALMGCSALPIAGVVLARAGWVAPGVALLGTGGILVELGATAFYGGIPENLTGTINRLPVSLWVPFLAGIVPGALSVALGFAIFKNRYFAAPQG